MNSSNFCLYLYLNNSSDSFLIYYLLRVLILFINFILIGRICRVQSNRIILFRAFKLHYLRFRRGVYKVIYKFRYRTQPSHLQPSPLHPRYLLIREIIPSAISSIYDSIPSAKSFYLQHHLIKQVLTIIYLYYV